jgi:hypothetical protein
MMATPTNNYPDQDAALGTEGGINFTMIKSTGNVIG